MGKHMILYWMQPDGKENGPFVAQILSSFNEGVVVTDEDVIKYVKKMHGIAPSKIERTNLIDKGE